MTWNTDLTKLRDVLAELYPSYESYHRVAVEAGLPSGDIPSRGKPVDIWHGILMEAQRRGQVQAIVTLAHGEYQENEDLTRLFELVGNDRLLIFPSTTPEQPSKQYITRTNEEGNMQQDRWSRVKEALRQLGVSERRIWRVKAARDHLAYVSSMGAPLLPDFTLHNPTHSDNVVLLLTGLQSEFKFGVSGYEAYLLAASAYLHDLGMFFDGERFRQKILPDPKKVLPACPENRCDRIQNYRLKGKEIGEQIREAHNLLSALMLQEGPGIRSVVGQDSLPYVMAICRGHRRADLRKQDCICYKSERSEGDVIRVGLLAALLRLADAMDFCRNRAPKEVFDNRAPSFMKNPIALEHWLKHYFVTDPHVTPQDQSGEIALVCKVSFRVPVKQVNGASYLDFFMPLFDKHIEDLNRKELDINQYPPILARVLGITAMQAIPAKGARPGFRDLPEEVIEGIQESGCKNIIDFVQWLQHKVGGTATASRPPKKSPEVESGGPFCLKASVQPEHFYNRDRAVRHALKRLHNSENVEVTGARRIGKTWFLQYLSHPSTLERNGMDPRRDIFVYVDCQHRLIRQEKPLVYEGMLERVVDAVGRAGVDLGLKLRDAPASGTTFEQVLKEMSRRGLRTVLLMDEFEEMVQNPNLDAGFFSHLRALWSADDVKVAYVTASCARLVKLFSEHRFLGSPFFDRFRPLQLGLFEKQDSRHLIEDSLRKAGVRLPEELVELVLEVGDGHPFFVQMAGDTAFELKIAGEELTEGRRETFLNAVNTETAGHFEHCWKKLTEQEQYVLAALPLLRKDRSYQVEIERLREQCLIARRASKDGYISPLFEGLVRRQKVRGLLQAGPLLVDQRRKEVLLRGKQLDLDVPHFDLLAYLVERAGQVVGNEDLWRAAWPKEPYESVEQLATNIESLRKALGDSADCIVDRRGAGYMFQNSLE